MKYILILLISFAFGQVYVPIQQAEIDTGSDLSRAIEKYEKTQWLRESVTVQDVLDYAEECYNDSTIYRYVLHMNGIDYFSTKLDSIDLATFPCDTIYTHKQPTFKGFREWLKK